jgi:hypothetical protein
MSGAVRLRGNVVYQLDIRWDGVTWTDETSRLKSFTVQRGQSDDLAQTEAGTLALVMKDTTGRFNPANAASPLQPYITYPLRQVRLRATYSSTTYYLFSGYTRRHESDPGRDAREARLDCIDAFVLLDGYSPVTATGATTGAAIASILAEAGFSGSTDLDTGDTITYAATGQQTALAAIGDLLTTERGFFYIAANGTAVYLDRQATNHSPYTSSQGTIASTMRAIAPGIDLDRMYNRVTVTRTGGVAQTYSDTTGALGTLLRDYPAVTSPYLADDNQAMALAHYLVGKGKNPIPPVRALDLSQHDAATFAQLLARELGDRVTVTESLGGTAGDYHIRRIVHEANWGAGVHRGSWALLLRDTQQPFIIDQSVVGSLTDALTY